METVAGNIRALREGDDAAKTAAAAWLGSLADNESSRALIAGAGGIAPLVELLCDGSAGAKLEAALALRNLAYSNPYGVLIAEAGGIPLLVDLVRDGSAEAAQALNWLAFNSANKVLIAEVGGIPPLVELLRDGSGDAKRHAAFALRNLAYYNNDSAVAIAVAVGFEGIVQLARRSTVVFKEEWLVSNAGLPANANVPAKRKAALVVAALLGDCVPDSVPREIKGLIGPYL